MTNPRKPNEREIERERERREQFIEDPGGSVWHVDDFPAEDDQPETDDEERN
ncbi:hypothetical protein U879_05970 [Defluviimonas sp. 20V17]|uniref:Uncharacterized protein n=1 Tax=Allgaiera indica TaxID=765699 RepID=A0AAN4UPG5_9RHOB|nr:hypothetical protein [Allgaiera indica]KDB04580.1 hypothetical protein U879_05970 [Defluviimonas sp. 20V17]GHD99794.1 hypothetical protein GCM10008024_08740 [Allgaiera indica]SDW18041.1 hypothetical protein SAMN05444006_1022 [Allgaiera indica]